MKYKNCNFELNPINEEQKEVLSTVAKALLNITEVYKNASKPVDALLKFENSDDININNCSFFGGETGVKL